MFLVELAVSKSAGFISTVRETEELGFNLDMNSGKYARKTSFKIGLTVEYSKLKMYNIHIHFSFTFSTSLCVILCVDKFCRYAHEWM